MLVRAFVLATIVLALTAEIMPLNNPCLDPKSNFSSQPWCDHSLPIDGRVEDMVSRMTIQEKIANLDTQAPAIPSLGLNSYNWWVFLPLNRLPASNLL
jgi:hypothetical protein